MKIKLTRAMPIDGLTFGKGSELTLGPDYAMALVERGDAVPVKQGTETATVNAPEATSSNKPKSARKESPAKVKG